MLQLLFISLFLSVCVIFKQYFDLKIERESLESVRIDGEREGKDKIIHSCKKKNVF